MKKLYVSAECNVDNSRIDMFYITGDKLVDDADVSKELNISIEKYWSILKKYGAIEIDTYEPMFGTYEEAQACINYLNQGTYIEDIKYTGCIVKIIGCYSIPNSFLGRYGIVKQKSYDNKWIIELNARVKNLGSFEHTVSEDDFEVIGRVDENNLY